MTTYRTIVLAIALLGASLAQANTCTDPPCRSEGTTRAGWRAECRAQLRQCRQTHGPTTTTRTTTTTTSSICILRHTTVSGQNCPGSFDCVIVDNQQYCAAPVELLCPLPCPPRCEVCTQSYPSTTGLPNCPTVDCVYLDRVYCDFFKLKDCCTPTPAP